MTNDCARFVAQRILEQAIDDATNKRIFIRPYNNNLAEVHKHDTYHFFKSPWFVMVCELAGFEPEVILDYVGKCTHKKVRKTL